MQDPLGDRLKHLENRHTRLLQEGWMCARMDGRNFSRLTKCLAKPFDPRMSRSMVFTAREMMIAFGAHTAYTQSDEITLLWAPRDIDSPWDFKGRYDKWLSLLAGKTSSLFLKALRDEGCTEMADNIPHFDARLMDGLDEQDAQDFLSWRMIDARRNAIQMLAQHHFPKKSLMGQNLGVVHQRLIDNGTPFEDQPDFFKNGTLLSLGKRDLTPQERAIIPERHRPDPKTPILRTIVVSDTGPF